jgi:hypothetical protein
MRVISDGFSHGYARWRRGLAMLIAVQTPQSHRPSHGLVSATDRTRQSHMANHGVVSASPKDASQANFGLGMPMSATSDDDLARRKDSICFYVLNSLHSHLQLLACILLMGCSAESCRLPAPESRQPVALSTLGSFDASRSIVSYSFLH